MQNKTLIPHQPPRARVAALLVAVLAFAPALARAQAGAPLPPVVVHADGEKVKFSGVVVQRDGDRLQVRQGDVALHTVVLTDRTKIETPSGIMKLERIHRDPSQLLPGLRLQVEGRGGPDGTVIAKEIKFSSTSLRTAEQINGGQEVLKNQVGANVDSIAHVSGRVTSNTQQITANAQRLAATRQRITDLDSYDELQKTTVNFAVNSFDLSDDAKRSLDAIAGRTSGLKGFMVEIVGYADVTGTESHNYQLSRDRADAVTAYLLGRGVPIRRLSNPTGLGENHPVESNATPSGRAANRRVDVRLLQSRGQQTETPRKK